MSDVTFVCCYNDSNKYEKFIESLYRQTHEFKVIGIDNRNGKFPSISKAYNTILKSISTEFVIFSHQDIILKEEDSLASFIGYLGKIQNDDILGVAGVELGDYRVYTNIYTDLDEKVEAGNSRFTGLKKCFTVDECFFGGYTSHFQNNRFNEILCNSWHLYAVEACLNTLKNGNNVYICDIELIHYSRGNEDKNFNINFYRLCKAYRRSFKEIRTTCAHAYTDTPGRIYCFLRRELKRNLIKSRIIKGR